MTTIPSPPQPGYTPPQPGGFQADARASTYGAIGEQRPFGKQTVLAIVTFGLYGVYWAYVNHEEIKQHTGEGIGGAFGAVIYAIAGIVTLFLLPIEIKKMYERDGKTSPVGPATAFWILAFGLPWYYKCQKALNEYWASKGAPAPDGWAS